MDATATPPCASEPASSVAANASQPPPAHSSAAPTVVAAAVVAAPSSSAKKPPLGRPRTAASTRPRGVARPRQQPSPSASAPDDSDDAGSGDAAGAGARNCPTRAQALQEFLRCVAAEISDIVAAFRALPNDARSFASFKSLWLERRLSAMFLVEFWDSTPSDTHHAVFQVALELLEDAVQSATQTDDASICTALGFWFALYCAFSVQLSEPKIKIAVDVVAWQSLTQLSGLLTQQLTLPQFADAARESLAMLRRLEHEDDAFMKCLGGAVAEFRLKARAHRLQLVGGSSQTSLPELVLPPHREEEMEDVVMRFAALNAQYNAALKQLAGVESVPSNKSSHDPATTSNGGRGSGASRGRGRGSDAPSFLRRSRPSELTGSGSNGVGNGFLQEASLWGGARAAEHESWVARVRQSLTPAGVDTVDGRAPSSGILRRRRSNEMTLFNDSDGVGDDVDAALFALEQELEREEAAVGPPNTQPPTSRWVTRQQRRPPTGKTTTSATSARHTSKTQPQRGSTVASSGQESDGLDELEAELARDVGLTDVASRLAQRVAPVAPRRAHPPIRVPAKRAPRAPSVLSMDTESDGLAELEAELARDTQRGQQSLPQLTEQADLPVRRSIVPRVTRSRAISIASTAEESDGLEELEAELTRDTQLPKQLKNMPTRGAAFAAVASVAPRAPRMTRSRAMSIASTGEETDGLEELEAELSRWADAVPPPPRVAVLSSRNAAPPKATVKTRVTRKRAISIASSGLESDGLSELEAELGQDPHIAAAPSSSRGRSPHHQQAVRQTASHTAPVRHLSQAVVTPAARPPRTQTRYSSRFSDVSSVDELNILQEDLDASLKATSVEAPVASPPAPSRKRSAAASLPAAPPSKRVATKKSPPKQSVTTSGAPPTRRSRRLSDASSAMGESDAELLALQAELATNPLTKAPAPSSKRNITAKAFPQQRLRSMSMLSDMTETDDELKELQAELSMTTEAAVPAEQTVSVKKPRAKKAVATKPTSKQPRKRGTASAASRTAVSTSGGTFEGDEPSQKPKQPRKPRQPKASTVNPKAQQKASTTVTQPTSTLLLPPSAPVASSRSTRLSSRRSVASSYDSDGLDELENELRAFS